MHENRQAKVPLFKTETRGIPIHAFVAFSSKTTAVDIAPSAHRELSLRSSTQVVWILNDYQQVVFVGRNHNLVLLGAQS